LQEDKHHRPFTDADAFQYQLSEFIQPLSQEEYKKLLDVAGDGLEKRMVENRSVLQRLKERE
jgi:hypothetical protein